MLGRLALTVVGLGVLLCLLVFAPVAYVTHRAVGELGGQIDALPALAAQLGDLDQRSVILDREGNRIEQLQVENRVVVGYDRIPLHVVDAVVATEDQKFWRHQGLDVPAILRAAVGNLEAGQVTGGGSTITQQLVKNQLLSNERSLVRKAKEALGSYMVEQRLPKEQILELYLNQAYFGQGVYGIATAAEHYFSTEIDEVTLGQAATLAGMIRAPAANNPVDSPENARARRDVVLRQMASAGFVSQRRADRVAARPLDADVRPPPEREHPFFTDFVRQQIEREPALGGTPEERWDRALRGGLRIRTTLAPDLQDAADAIIAETLDQPDDPMATLVAVDPRDGEILAMGVGPKGYGSGANQTQVNPAVPGGGGSGRQSGSAFKPFQLVAALEEGVEPTHGWESVAEYRPDPELGCREDWVPANYDDQYLGWVDMAGATARSSNTYFVHLLELTGVPKLAETAQRMGITTELSTTDCSIVLGAADVYPLDMASAFGTLATNGRHCEPTAIAEITDDGETIMRADGGCEQVVDPEIAWTTTQLLQGPLRYGTAAANGQIGRPAAGKTGTTSSYRDAWFVGYVPQLSVASWIGHEQPRELEHPACGNVTGGCLPTMLWRDFMLEAIETLDLEYAGFEQPDGS